MDLGNVKLNDGVIPDVRPNGRQAEDNSTAEQWIEMARQAGTPKSVTVPGAILQNDQGKTVYDGVAKDVVNRLRRAIETYNRGKANEDCIGLRLNVQDARKAGTVTVNFQVTKKVFRPRKPKVETTAE